MIKHTAAENRFINDSHRETAVPSYNRNVLPPLPQCPPPPSVLDQFQDSPGNGEPQEVYSTRKHYGLPVDGLNEEKHDFDNGFLSREEYREDMQNRRIITGRDIGQMGIVGRMMTDKSQPSGQILLREAQPVLQVNTNVPHSESSTLHNYSSHIIMEQYGNNKTKQPDWGTNANDPNSRSSANVSRWLNDQSGVSLHKSQEIKSHNGDAQNYFSHTGAALDDGRCVLPNHESPKLARYGQSSIYESSNIKSSANQLLHDHNDQQPKSTSDSILSRSLHVKSMQQHHNEPVMSQNMEQVRNELNSVERVCPSVAVAHPVQCTRPVLSSLVEYDESPIPGDIRANRKDESFTAGDRNTKSHLYSTKIGSASASCELSSRNEHGHQCRAQEAGQENENKLIMRSSLSFTPSSGKKPSAFVDHLQSSSNTKKFTAGNGSFRPSTLETGTDVKSSIISNTNKPVSRPELVIQSSSTDEEDKVQKSIPQCIGNIRNQDQF